MPDIANDVEVHSLAATRGAASVEDERELLENSLGAKGPLLGFWVNPRAQVVDNVPKSQADGVVAEAVSKVSSMSMSSSEIGLLYSSSSCPSSLLSSDQHGDKSSKGPAGAATHQPENRALFLLRILIMLVAALLLALVGLALTAPTARDISLEHVNYIFSFGDSYTDSGFNPFGAKPTPSCALGNPSCVTGNTLAGGHDWMTALTSVYNKSLTLTYNFAVSGYVIDSDIVPSRSGVKQLEFQDFLETSATHPNYAPWRGDNSLFSMFIGINDIGATFQTQDLNSTFFDREFDSWTAIMDQIYSIGGRKFLFVNVPATWRTPMFATLNSTDQQKLINAVHTWNENLVRRMDRLRDSHKDVEVFLWDAYATFNKILDNPTEFGFIDNSTQCSSPPGNCFWWNNYHPSSSAHLLFAHEVSGLLDRFWIPANAVKPIGNSNKPRWLSWLSWLGPLAL